MKTTFNSAEIDLLISKLLDQLLSDDESKRLIELLKTDSKCRSRYSYLMLQESLLHWEESDGLSLRQPNKKYVKIINFSVLTSLAASIVISSLEEPPPPPPEPPSEVIVLNMAYTSF